MDVTKVFVDGRHDLARQETILRESAPGSLYAISAFEVLPSPERLKNMAAYDPLGDLDDKIVLKVVPPGAAPSLDNHDLVCLGQVFVSGAVQSVAAFRPR